MWGEGKGKGSHRKRGEERKLPVSNTMWYSRNRGTKGLQYLSYMFISMIYLYLVEDNDLSMVSIQIQIWGF